MESSSFLLDLMVGNATVWLNGGNEPPCCDFFSYTMNGAATILHPPDSHELTRRGLARIVRNYGMPEGARFGHGDIDRDNAVTMLDVGSLSIDDGSGALQAIAIVPEPCSLGMMVMGLVILSLRRRV